MPTLQFQRPFTKTEYRNWNCLPILALSGVSYRYEKTCWIMLSIAARAWVVSSYSDAIEQRYQKWFIIWLNHLPTFSLPLVLATWQPLMYMTLDHFCYTCIWTWPHALIFTFAAKCEDWVIAYRRWSLAKKNRRGLLWEVVLTHLLYKDNLLHVISKVGYVQFHVVTTVFCMSSIVNTHSKHS